MCERVHCMRVCVARRTERRVLRPRPSHPEPAVRPSRPSPSPALWLTAGRWLSVYSHSPLSARCVWVYHPLLATAPQTSPDEVNGATLTTAIVVLRDQSEKRYLPTRATWLTQPVRRTHLFGAFTQRDEVVDCSYGRRLA